MFLKLIKVYLLVSELHIYQNARFNDKNHRIAVLSQTDIQICVAFRCWARSSRYWTEVSRSVKRYSVYRNIKKQKHLYAYSKFILSCLFVSRWFHFHLLWIQLLLMPVSITDINPYPTAFPYGNGMVLHFYQQQESSTTKTVHKVINRGLETYVKSPHTGENFH